MGHRKEIVHEITCINKSERLGSSDFDGDKSDMQHVDNII